MPGSKERQPSYNDPVTRNRPQKKQVVGWSIETDESNTFSVQGAVIEAINSYELSELQKSGIGRDLNTAISKSKRQSNIRTSNNKHITIEIERKRSPRDPFG